MIKTRDSDKGLGVGFFFTVFFIIAVTYICSNLRHNFLLLQNVSIDLLAVVNQGVLLG